MGERMDVDVSLDDYITEKHIHRPRNGTNNSNSNKGDSSNNRQGGRDGNFRNNRGGSGFRPRGINKPFQQNNFRRRTGGDGGYVDMDGGFDAQTLALQQTMPLPQANVRMFIKNLDRNVNDDDIRDLFAEFGPVQQLNVNYDKMGRSLGSAEIVFVSYQDALRAKQKYDNVPLDGLPMRITFEGATNREGGGVAQRLGNRRGNFAGADSGAGGGGRFNNTNNNRFNNGAGGNFNGRQNNFRRGGGGNRQNAGGNKQQQKPISAEALDAELDAYKAQPNGL